MCLNGKSHIRQEFFFKYKRDYLTHLDSYFKVYREGQTCSFRANWLMHAHLNRGQTTDNACATAQAACDPLILLCGINNRTRPRATRVGPTKHKWCQPTSVGTMCFLKEKRTLPINRYVMKGKYSYNLYCDIYNRYWHFSMQIYSWTLCIYIRSETERYSRRLLWQL